MKIVKRDSFRSQGTLVNKTDDMYRVVVDMTRGEFFAFSQWAARQNTKESPENSPASPVQHAQAKMPSWEEIWKSLYHLEPPCVSDILGGKVIRYYAYAVYDYIARHIGCAQ